MLSQARVSGVLALDPSAMGSIVSLPERAPITSVVRAFGKAPPMPTGDPEDDDDEDMSSSTSIVETPATAVAIVSIDGPLAQRAIYDMCGYVDGYDAVAARVCEALASPAIGAVVLRISSPGGDVSGLEAAVSRMRSAVDASEKSVFAFVDETAASAAYWIAAGVADKIYLPESGMVGSIGCFSMLVDETKALEQDGISVEIVRDPPGKAENHPLGPVSELARTRAQEMVSAVTARFNASVSARRGVSAKDVTALDGAVLSGSAAVAAGLADGVSTLEGVIAMAGTEAATKALAAAATNTMAGLAGVAPEALSAEHVKEIGPKLAASIKFSAAASSLTGESDLSAALGMLAAWKVSHETAEVERKAHAEERKTREATERRETLSALVTKLGPAKALAKDDSGMPIAGKAVEWIEAMQIDAFRAFAATILESNASAAPEPVKAAAKGDEVDKGKAKIFAKYKVDPAAYAEFTKGKIKGARAKVGG